jgi:hypothetical protein
MIKDRTMHINLSVQVATRPQHTRLHVPTHLGTPLTLRPEQQFIAPCHLHTEVAQPIRHQPCLADIPAIRCLIPQRAEQPVCPASHMSPR